MNHETSAHVAEKIGVQYKLEVLRNGEIVKSTEFRPNMITDWGFNRFYQHALLSCFERPFLGDGLSPCPIRRDSGAITFTQSGTTLTASATFFVAEDTGRLFKWGTGSGGAETYLTYINGTTCTTSTSDTVSTPTIGTIWFVNVSGLSGLLSFSWSNEPGAALNFNIPTVDGDTCSFLHQKVFNSSAFSVPRTITEIAFGQNSDTANFRDIDIINPPIAFLAGDQARVTLQVTRVIAGITPQVAPNVGVGYDSSGLIQVESSKNLQVYGSDGSIQDGTTPVEINHASYIRAAQSPITLQPFTLGNVSYTSQSNGAITWSAYGTGNFYIDVEGSWAIDQANGTIYGVMWGEFSYRTITLKFDTPITKTSSQTFKLKLRKSWSRILVN